MLLEGLGNSVDFLEEIEAMVLRTILGYRLAFVPSFLDLCPPGPALGRAHLAREIGRSPQ